MTRILLKTVFLLGLLGAGCSEVRPDDSPPPPPDQLTGNCDLSHSDAYNYVFIKQSLEGEPTRIQCVSENETDSLLFGSYTYNFSAVGVELLHLNGGTLLQLYARELAPRGQRDFVFVDASESTAEVISDVPGLFVGAAFDESAERLYALNHDTDDITDLTPPFTHFLTVFDANLNRIAQYSFETEETYFLTRALDVNAAEGLLVVSYERWVQATGFPGTSNEEVNRVLLFNWNQDNVQVLENAFENQVISDIYFTATGTDILFRTFDRTPNRDDRLYYYDVNSGALRDIFEPGPRPDHEIGRNLVRSPKTGKFYYNVYDSDNTSIYEIDHSGTVARIHEEAGVFRWMRSTEEELCLQEAFPSAEPLPEFHVFSRLSLPDFGLVRRDTVAFGGGLPRGFQTICR